MNLILMFMSLKFITLLLNLEQKKKAEGVWGVPYDDQALMP